MLCLLVTYIVGPHNVLQRLAISFVRKDEVAERMVLEDIEEYYSTHIDEMPANVDDII